MKAHIGVDAASGLVHTMVTTPANAHDITQAHALLHGEEQEVYGDSGYQGVEKREENKGKKVDWVIAMRHGKRRKLRESGTEEGRLVDKIEQLKCSGLIKADARLGGNAGHSKVCADSSREVLAATQAGLPVAKHGWRLYIFTFNNKKRIKS